MRKLTCPYCKVMVTAQTSLSKSMGNNGINCDNNHWFCQNCAKKFELCTCERSVIFFNTLEILVLIRKDLIQY